MCQWYYKFKTFVSITNKIFTTEKLTNVLQGIPTIINSFYSDGNGQSSSFHYHHDDQFCHCFLFFLWYNGTTNKSYINVRKQDAKIHMLLVEFRQLLRKDCDVCSVLPSDEIYPLCQSANVWKTVFAKKQLGDLATQRAVCASVYVSMCFIFCVCVCMHACATEQLIFSWLFLICTSP